MLNDKNIIPFEGFTCPNYTLVPKVLVDSKMQDLKTSEIRCLMYIMGHTFGWKKQHDNISLSQFLNGVIKRNSQEYYDRGVGLSKATLLKALKALEQQNLILRQRRKAPDGNNLPTQFSLNLKSNINKKQGTQGWTRSDFFQVPDQLFTQYLNQLSAKEIKLILFVARWTSHTENQQSSISIKQMQQGIYNKNKVCLGQGCGINDTREIHRVIKKLTDKQLLNKIKQIHKSNGNMPSLFSLYPMQDLMVENIPRLDQKISEVKTIPSLGVENEPSLKVKNKTSLGVKISPSMVVENSPHNIHTKTTLNLNTTAMALSKKFYQEFNLKVSQSKVKKGGELMVKLLEEGFSERELKYSISWLKRKYPDTQHINRLSMLIDQALKDQESEKKQKNKTKLKVHVEKKTLQNLEKSKENLKEFMQLSTEIQNNWLRKAPKILKKKHSRMQYAATEYIKSIQNQSL